MAKKAKRKLILPVGFHQNQKKGRSLEDAEKIIERLVDDYEDQGCDGCGTVSRNAINEARRYLGMEQLGDEDSEEDLDDLDEDEEDEDADVDEE
jgi:uncharacterized protein YeeX (DUF496 family)